MARVNGQHVWHAYSLVHPRPQHLEPLRFAYAVSRKWRAGFVGLVASSRYYCTIHGQVLYGFIKGMATIREEGTRGDVLLARRCR